MAGSPLRFSQCPESPGRFKSAANTMRPPTMPSEQAMRPLPPKAFNLSDASTAGLPRLGSASAARRPMSVIDHQPQHAEPPAACLHDLRPRDGKSRAHGGPVVKKTWALVQAPHQRSVLAKGRRWGVPQRLSPCIAVFERVVEVFKRRPGVPRRLAGRRRRRAVSPTCCRSHLG
jgi:hypothetical protein